MHHVHLVCSHTLVLIVVLVVFLVRYAMRPPQS